MAVGVKGKKQKFSCGDALLEKIRQCAPIVDVFPDIAYFKDLDHRNVFINKAFEKFAGRKKSDIEGKRDDEILPKELARQCMKSDDAVRNGKPVHTDEALTDKDGKTAFFDTMKFPLRDGEGRIIGLMGISREITEKKRDEHELRESEASYRAIADNIPGIVYRIHLEGEKSFTEFFNENVQTLAGYPPEKLSGGRCPMDPLIVSEDRKNVIETIANAIKKGQPFKVEYRIKNKKGDIRYFAERGRPIFDEKMKAEHIDGVIFDVTQSKKADDAFRNVMDQYKYLYDESPAVNIIVGNNGKIMDINRKSAQAIGYKKEELVGKSIFDLMTASDIKKALTVLKDSIMNKYTPEMELAIKSKDGSIRRLLLSEGGTPIYDKGKAVGVLVTGMDITERKKAEELTRQNEEKYRSIIELAPDGIISVSLKGTVTACNSAFEKLTGYSKEEIVGKHFTSLPTINKKDMPSYIKLFTSIIRGKIPESFKFEWKHKNGSLHMGEIRVGLMKSGNKITGMQAFISDITERLMVEKRAKEDEDKYKFLVDSMQEIAIILSKTGTILFANRSALETLGYTEEEVIGKSIVSFLTKGSLKKALYALAQEFLGKHQEEMEVEVKNKKSEIRTLLIAESSNPIHKDGKMIGILVNARDITEQKKTNELRRESGEQFRKLFNEMPDAVIILDKKGTLLEMSKEAEKISGYPRNELIGRNIFATRILDMKTKALTIRKLALHFSGESVLPFEVKIYRKDGGTVPLEIKPQMIDYMGKEADLIALRDLTERKIAEAAVSENEERYRIQFEEALDTIVIANAKTGIIVDCNRAATQLVGRDKSELIGQHQRILHPPEDTKGQFSETFKKHISVAKGQPLEARIITKSGEIKFVTIKANLIEMRGEKLIQGIFRDITEWKRVENELRKSDERFRQITENAYEWVWEVDTNGVYTYSNTIIERILGYTSDELVGKVHFYDLFAPDVKEQLKKAALETFAKKQPIRGFINQNLHKNGNMIILETNCAPILDEKGRLLGYRGADTDITERKKTEDIIKESESRYKLMAEQTGQVIYDYEIASGAIKWSGAIMDITGYTPEGLQKMGIKEWGESIHPDDSKNVSELLDKAIKQCTKFDSEYRFMRKDGSYVYVEDRGIVLKDAKGKPYRMLGTMKDITYRKKADDEIKNRTEELERFNRLAVGRELKMIELKNRIEDLEKKLRENKDA